MVKRHMKKCSASSGIRRMQIKTRMRYIPTTMVKLKGLMHHQMLAMMWNHQKRHTLLVGKQNCTTILEKGANSFLPP